MVLVIAFPLLDAWKLRAVAEPYNPEPEVYQALNWLSQGHESDLNSNNRVFALGFTYWDTFLIPYHAQVPLAAGWYDEGASNWHTVQRLRTMALTRNADAVLAHRLLVQIGATKVLIYDWDSTQNPRLFQSAFEQHPELFKKQAEWGQGPRGKIMAFEVLES